MKIRFKLLFFILLLISCNGSKKSVRIDGQWFVHNIIYKKVDVLGNPIDKKFELNVVKTRILKIGTQGNLYLFLDRHNPISAEIKYNDNFILISSKKLPLINGKYEIMLDTLRTRLSGIDSYDIRATLKTKEVTIYMNRFEMANRQ